MAPSSRRGHARHRERDVAVRVATLITLLFTTVACGSGASQTTPNQPSATSAAATLAPTVAPATVAATAAPATQVGPAEPCSGPECQMLAGEYRASSLAGDFTFRLIGEAWSMVAYTPEILSLRSTDNWLAFMSGEIRLRKGDAIEMSTDPARAQDRLATFPGITVTPADEPVTIGAQDAVAFDVTNTGDETVQLWGLGNTSGMYSLDPGASVRMLWVDRDGIPFILALEAPTESFASFLSDSQAVIDSIAFD